MNQEGMLKPVLIGGVLIGILSVAPIISLGNCLCCAWVIGGGILASYLYVKASLVAVTLGRGVLLGLLAGAVGALVDTLFTIPLQILLARFGMGASEEIQQLLDQVPQLPPDLRKAVTTLLASGKGISFLLIVVGGFSKLLIYSVVAMLGGAIGVAIFEKRDLRMVPPEHAISYQPPAGPPAPPPDTPQPPNDAASG